MRVLHRAPSALNEDGQGDVLRPWSSTRCVLVCAEPALGVWRRGGAEGVLWGAQNPHVGSACVDRNFGRAHAVRPVNFTHSKLLNATVAADG